MGEQTVVQSENPAQSSRQDQEVVKVKTYTVPAGSRLEETKVVAVETEQRIYALNAWRETPFFTEKERAALAWTESVTQVSTSQVPNEIYEIVRQYFDEKEIVNITTAIVSINGWNRFAVSFRSVPGAYQPAKH